MIEFHQGGVGEFYTNVRRVEDYVWLRVHDHQMPVFTQNGAHFPVPDRSRYFGRCGLSRWVVPVDDTRTMVITWRHFRDGDDPKGLTDRSKVGFGTTDFYGQGPDRSYEQRQRDPGDYDAWVSQGPVNVHARENLAFTDRGVAKVRRLLRKNIRALRDKGEVERPTDAGAGTIPTYGGDTILRIPPQEGRDDAALLKEISFKVADIYTAADGIEGAARGDRIRADLKAYESGFA